jgi:hypothetical protein
MIFFSDTTWRMELKIVMNDHCQKVTTLDKDLARNISAKYGSNPSSGS